MLSVINLSDSISIEKILTLHDVITIITPLPIKDQNHYCYNIYLEKCPYQVAK